MTRIFISYARADGSEIANLLNGRLSLKHDVFLDTVDIPGGAEWEKLIAREIRRSRLMIVVVTPAVHKSKYVYQEFEQADRKGKIIVPFQVNQTELPVFLQRFNAVSLDYVDPKHHTLDQALEDLRLPRLPAHLLKFLVMTAVVGLMVALALAWYLTREKPLSSQGSLLNVIINGVDPSLCTGESDTEVASKSWSVTDPLTAASCVKFLLKWEPKAVSQQLARLQDGTCRTQPSPQAMQIYFRDNWALTSLATGYYNLGRRFEQDGHYRLAEETFQRIVSNYSCAWIWDQGQGLFWSMGQSAQDELDRLSQTAVPTPVQ